MTAIKINIDNPHWEMLIHKTMYITDNNHLSG